jgi:hypothetical protein
MKIILPVVFALLSATTGAQTGHEIYLADIDFSKTGITISNPKNVTNRKGYDNQPSFHPDKPIIYYSSFNDSSLAEIKTYNYKLNKTGHLTQTREHEYSPTVTPDKKYISCIIQRSNGAQDLAKFPIEGGKPIIIINNLTVGYHTWLSATKLALFVLDEPNMLRIYNTATGRDSAVAASIGRSLHKIPNQSAFSFIDKSVEPWKIKSVRGKHIDTICETLPGREDLTWTHDGKIIMTDGQQFFYYDTKTQLGWKAFYTSPVAGISRIALSRNSKKIAFVVSE